MNTLNNSPFPSGAHLTAYLRDSEGEEQDLSVEQQENVITSWAEENHYILALIFKHAASTRKAAWSRAAGLLSSQLLAGHPILLE